MECKFFDFETSLTFLYICVERYTEIERENRILLEKMSNIMQNPKPKLYNPGKYIFSAGYHLHPLFRNF